MGIVLSIYGKAIVRILMIRIEYVVGTQIITTKKYFCPCRACRQSRTERQCKCSIIYNAIAINQGYGQLQDTTICGWSIQGEPNIAPGIETC